MDRNRTALLFLLSLALLNTACSQAPVRSTVDAYGEGSAEVGTPLCFIRETLPLRDKPIVDECREAARMRGIPVTEPGSTECSYVVVTSNIFGATREISTSPRFGTSVGIYGGMGPFGGFGLGSGSTEVREMAERQMNLTFYRDSTLKEALRSIDVRSAGKESSVAAVAYEMCEAALSEYPRNVKGKVYNIKRRDDEKP